jgi:hypothetical protein
VLDVFVEAALEGDEPLLAGWNMVKRVRRIASKPKTPVVAAALAAPAAPAAPSSPQVSSTT